jgi:prophage regulatory protein
MAIPEKAILRRAEVKRLTGFSVSTLYRLAKSGDFPKPVKIGARASGWLAGEVEAWIEARVAASRGEAA